MANRGPGPHPRPRELVEPCEIYFSVVQRKVITPNDFYDLADVQDRLEAFKDRYNFTARPFNWKYTTKDLHDLLDRLAAHHTGPLSTAA